MDQVLARVGVKSGTAPISRLTFIFTWFIWDLMCCFTWLLFKSR